MLKTDFFFVLIAVISGNINRLDTDTKDQLTTLTEKDKLVISIGRTDPEIMKQVIIFMYTSKCDLNERNGKILSFFFFNNDICQRPISDRRRSV
jgi:hypothetical protein